MSKIFSNRNCSAKLFIYMINYTQEQFDEKKDREKLSLICDYCERHFERTKTAIKVRTKVCCGQYCSAQCQGKDRKRKSQVTKMCQNCGEPIIRRPSGFHYKYAFCGLACSSQFSSKIWMPKYTNGTTITQPCGTCGEVITKPSSTLKNSKCGLIFCNRHCAGIYVASHRAIQSGSRTSSNRSKLELYLEKELQTLFPAVHFLFNEKKTTGYELDIYAPDLKFAVELNGIFHYKKIYKNQAFERSQELDQIKTEQCQKQGINLLVIDTSKQNRFNARSNLTLQFLQEITATIDNLLQ